MKVGLCTIAFQEKPLSDALEIAAKCGYDAVEIWCKPPHDPGGFDPAYWAGIAEQMAAHLLDTPVIGSYLRGTEKDFDAQAARVLKIADALDSKLIRVWAGGKGSKDATDADWDVVVSAYARLAAKATDYRFCFERHGGTLTDDWPCAKKLLERLPQSNVGLNYQFLRGETTALVCKSLAEGKDRLLNFHVQNEKKLPDGSRQPADAESGDLDYRAILATLKEIGFAGYLETEFVRDGVGDPKSPEAKMAAARRECGYLKQLVGG
jgi:sugar phosphate isomerase/epimerase